MHNLAFNVSRGHKSSPRSFPNLVEVVQPNGRVQYVECSNPYEGLSSDSFELSAQLAAGVPLQHVGPMASGAIDSVDVNNDNALKFVQKFV